jgi:hypothetical protein
MRLFWVVVVSLVVSSGCADSKERRPPKGATASRDFQDQPPMASFGPAEKPMVLAQADRQGGEEGVGAGQGKPADDAPAKTLPRKIIYTAQMELVVEDFASAEQEIGQLIKAQDAYIAKSDIRGSPGSPRQGTWTIRVPADRFEALREALLKLGELQRTNIDSQDVSDEYYDLDARIKNKKVEEERLLRHLDKSTGKLEDILAVEREISRVRGEIERQQGRLKYLSQMTALTTVTVTLHERKGYVPPAAPTFATSVGRTFEGSVETLAGFGKGVALVIVALVPWLPVLAVLGLLGWLVVRRRVRAVPHARQPAPAVPAQPG